MLSHFFDKWDWRITFARMTTPLIQPGLDLAGLVRVAAENSDFEIHGDVNMAKRCWAALNRLSLMHPSELQQGGVGRGSGFSGVWNLDNQERMRQSARAFVQSQSPTGSKFFGFFAGDPRHLHCVPGIE